MPKRSQTFQAGFQKGIVENVQQDALGRQGTLESALYIDNYNPNLEMLTLVKRLCYGIIGQWESKTKTVMPSYLVDELNATFMAYGNVQVEMMFENPEKRVFFVKIVVSGGIVPANYKTYTYVLDLSHTWNDTSSNVFQWANAILRAYPDYYAPALYPGYKSPGIYQHHVRYGDALLFTTMPEYKSGTGGTLVCGNINEHFPVYVYYKWNLNNKRRNEAGEDRNCVFWNGIYMPLNPLPAFPNPDYNQWKIKTPSTKTLNVGLVSHVFSTIEKTGTPTDSWKNIYSAMSNPIEIIIAEVPLYKNEANINLRQKVSPACNHILFDSTNIPTCTRGDVLIEGSHPLYYEAPNTNEAYFASQEAPNDMDINIPICLYGYGSVPFSAKSYRFTDYEGGNRKVTALHDSSGTVYLGRLDGTRNIICTLAYYVPSYKENKMPRPWLKGEKIPLCLTATIDGVEVIIWQGTHTIQSNNLDLSIVKHSNGNILGVSTTNEYVVPETQNMDLFKSHVSGNEYDATDPMLVKRTHVESNGVRVNYNTYANVMYWMNPITPLATYIDHASNIPYIDLYQERTTIEFAIRIDKVTFNELLDMNVQSFKLYASKPDLTNNTWRSYGAMSYPSDINPAVFAKPVVQSDSEDDFTKYALIKEFVIDGMGSPICNDITTIVDDYSDYNGTPMPTNAWYEDVDNTCLWSVPQYKVELGSSTDNPPALELTNVIYDYAIGDRLAPDFILYDYPLDAPPLLLNNSGKYWKGKGARGLAVVKGCTFLIGCIDADGQEEQAVIRYSAVQNGNISPDVFPVENKLVIGHLPHTGAANYREQLLWFNRQAHYRMMIPTVTQPETWEFLDSIEGHGAFMQKAICVTPEGVCYCNENGIWITDGRIPQSLTFTANSSIESLYKYIATNAAYIYTQTVNPGQGLVNAQKGYNEYMELSYCADTDELIFSSPLHRYWKTLGGNADYYTPITTPTYADLNIEIRLIYHFKLKNWRVEHTNTQSTSTTLDGANPAVLNYIGATQYGPMKLSGAPYHAAWIDRASSVAHVATNQRVPTIEADEFDFINNAGQHQVFPSPFLGHVITHEVGDDENDSMMLRVILEAKPRHGVVATALNKIVESDNYWSQIDFVGLPYSQVNDPVFGYETRNTAWQWSAAPQRIVDLIKANMIRKLPFSRGAWSVTVNAWPPGNPWRTRLETPNQPAIGGNASLITANESLFLNVPINSYFRHCRFMLSSEYIIKVHGFTVEYTTFKRRGQ